MPAALVADVGRKVALKAPGIFLIRLPPDARIKIRTPQALHRAAVKIRRIKPA